MRVKLFAGSQPTRIEVSGSAPLSVSVGPTTRTVSTLDVDAAGNISGDGAIIARASTSPIMVRTTATMLVSASGGSVLASRHYNGSLSVLRSSGSLLAINAVDLESYVASTLASEISPSWHVESLKAQAIVNRTYGLRAAVHATNRPYDVVDDTSNQVYRGLDDVAPEFVSAASATAGMTLLASDTPADVFYSAVCGGHTASSTELTGRIAPTYLNGIADVDSSGRAFCTPAPFFAWENSVTGDSIARVVGIGSADLGDISISDRWPDGRAKTVLVARYGASSFAIDAHQFYARCSATLGYKVLPSTMFDISRTTEDYTFTGHGLGHGVGMCQWGARGRANAGQQAAQILEAYFPGTSLYNPTLR